MAISIIHLPNELQQATLSHLLAEALLGDFFLKAPEWLSRPLDTHSLVTIARLSSVCTLWRQLVYLVLRRALSPIGSITSPIIDSFPLWIPYGHALRHLHIGLRERRIHRLNSYRDLVPVPHQQPFQNQNQNQIPNPTPILVGTPPSSTPAGFPVPSTTQTPPLLTQNPINPSAPLGGVPVLPTLPPAATPIAIPVIGATVPHSTTTVLPPTIATPTITPITPNNPTNNSNIFFTILELHARADVFRRTYRGSGNPNCQVDQSLCITKSQAVDALASIHQARALLHHLNIDELGMALVRVLQETEDDITLGLRACEWQETLHRFCTFPPWDQQAACEVYPCLLEVERHINAASLPLLQLSRLSRMINTASSAAHIFPVPVGKELVDCRAKAHNLSMDLMALILHFDGSF